MNRLTKKSETNENEYDVTGIGGASDLINKLGKLEDVEEKLGIDLLTLKNTIGNRVFFVKDKDIRVLRVMSVALHKDNTWQLICGDEEEVLKKTIVKNKLYLSCWHYNKTWFLTKEEVEKKLSEVK